MSLVAGKIMPRPRGLYDPTAIYDILDMVNYNNMLWMSKKSNLQGVEPTESDTENWMLCITSKSQDLQALEATINKRIDQSVAKLEQADESISASVDAADASILERVDAADAAIEAANSLIQSTKTELQNKITSNTTEISSLKTAKADKPVVKSVTVPASGWSGDTFPYTNTISVSGVTSSNVVDLTLPSTVTSEEISVYQAAQILNASQAAGTITLNAWGTAPTINLPLTVIIRG